MGEPGADVVEELCGAGVVRGDLVGLAVAPRVGLRMATTGKMSVARGIEDPSVVVRFVEDALRPRWAVVERHHGDASPGGGADRDLLGRRGGASAPLRRMVGRSRLRVGAAPAFGVGHDPDGRAGGPVRRRRAQQRRSGRSDRPDGTSDRSGWAEVGVRLRNGCGGGQNWR